MLFKIQRPLATNVSMSMCLIYNQDRTIMGEVTLSRRMMKQVFPKGEPKRYFEGTFDPETGEVGLDRFVSDQPW